MSFKIAITGKGGVGKTTIAGLITLQLIARGKKPVLAVDADPNTCLDAAFGVTVQKSVGSVREEAREAAGKGISSGISKQQLIELQENVQEIINPVDISLLSMLIQDIHLMSVNEVKDRLLQIRFDRCLNNPFWPLVRMGRIFDPGRFRGS